MHDILYFLIGILLSVLIIKYMIPSQKVIRVLPSPENYKDNTYIDEDGVLYKYDIVEEKQLKK
jgi:hypothetical protein